MRNADKLEDDARIEIGPAGAAFVRGFKIGRVSGFIVGLLVGLISVTVIVIAAHIIM